MVTVTQMTTTLQQQERFNNKKRHDYQGNQDLAAFLALNLMIPAKSKYSAKLSQHVQGPLELHRLFQVLAGGKSL